MLFYFYHLSLPFHPLLWLNWIENHTRALRTHHTPTHTVLERFPLSVLSLHFLIVESIALSSVSLRCRLTSGYFTFFIVLLQQPAQQLHDAVLLGYVCFVCARKEARDTELLKPLLLLPCHCVPPLQAVPVIFCDLGLNESGSVHKLTDQQSVSTRHLKGALTPSQSASDHSRR